MTHTYDSLDTTLARDLATKKFSWFILPGRSMTFVRFDVPQAWMPQKPADIATVDQSKSSAFWHPRGVPMLRPTLNQSLQMYFHRVQRIMPRTCHPSIIHHEAHSIIHSVSSGPGQPKLWGNAVAKTLFHAGTARLEYTRTVSLLIHDVLIELNLHDWCAMRALRMHLEDVATSTILKAWSYFVPDPMFTGLERCTDSIDATRNEMFNAATFYGDLVAIDVIPRMSYALSPAGSSNISPRIPYTLGLFAGLAQQVALPKATQAAYA
ncbi:hypothetical protein AZE42_07696 [Rhizopogon vesiculosus]|uniref:Uncharacterized protein n=1 Tax=Rhizopogon vesiculosus TaxID=180088 RepID=A0A1J8PET0_9AGAM|nr:hypothetical protein AZE42_07696 [Rhizopogon vesiculosus]